MTRVAYELSGRPAVLVVDLAEAAAGWRVRDAEAQVTDVLALAPPDDVGRLIRHALVEIRAHAASNDRGAEQLRRLAAEVWRDYRRAIDGVGEQSPLPGV